MAARSAQMLNVKKCEKKNDHFTGNVFYGKYFSSTVHVMLWTVKVSQETSCGSQETHSYISIKNFQQKHAKESMCIKQAL